MADHSHTDSREVSRATARAGMEHTGRDYLLFGAQIFVSGSFMYLLMFLMIASWTDFHNNLNAFYMTLAMVGPMGIVMLALMPQMYPNRALNGALYAAFVLMFVLGIWLTREQAFIGDAQFLRSMIPHHSGAILMCRQADIADPEIAALCQRIIVSQQAEIDQMTAILDRL